MNELHEQLAQRTAQVRRRMDEACRAAGRAPESVQLCAASKTQTADTVRAAWGAGIDVFGENRVQELVEKRAAGAYGSTPLHFIGHLQTNKVRQVVGAADLIESVDSEHLLLAVQKEAARQGIVQPVLLQVNIGAEASKGGVAPEGLTALLTQADGMENILVKGLMCIPPKETDPAAQRRWFAAMRALFDQAAARSWTRTRMEILSMGMSGDFEAAIQEGATLVRVGTAIFGPRAYPLPAEP